MVKVPAKILKRINNYIADLNKHDIPIQKVILFGSYAKGNVHEYSDIDLALVSGVFTGNRFEDKDIIREITIDHGSDIEPLPYKTEDFTEDDPFVKEILETGIEL